MAEALARQDINAPAGSFYALEAARHIGLDSGLRVGLAPYSSAGDVTRLLTSLAELLS